MDRMLDLRKLHTFVAVVDTGSVTEAAHRLGFTPSSVSQQVAQLDREIGLALLEKSGRGIKPTSAGLTLAEQARTVLSVAAEAEAVMADLREGRTGRVRVVSFTSAGDSLMPVVVADLRRTRPGLQVATTISETDEAYDALRAGRVDVALVLEAYTKGHEPTDGLVRVHLLDDPYRVMLPVSHRLAGVPGRRPRGPCGGRLGRRGRGQRARSRRDGRHLSQGGVHAALRGTGRRVPCGPGVRRHGHRRRTRPGSGARAPSTRASWSGRSATSPSPDTSGR